MMHLSAASSIAEWIKTNCYLLVLMLLLFISFLVQGILLILLIMLVLIHTFLLIDLKIPCKEVSDTIYKGDMGMVEE